MRGTCTWNSQKCYFRSGEPFICPAVSPRHNLGFSDLFFARSPHHAVNAGSARQTAEQSVSPTFGDCLCCGQRFDARQCLLLHDGGKQRAYRQRSGAPVERQAGTAQKPRHRDRFRASGGHATAGTIGLSTIGVGRAIGGICWILNATEKRAHPAEGTCDKAKIIREQEATI